MDILYLLVPISVALVLVIIALFGWAIYSGQLDHLEGEGERIEYDSRADRVTLINRAQIRRYRGTVLNDDITGQRIIYENLTDQFTVDGKNAGSKPGAESSGRVRAVLTPRKKDEAGK